MNLHLGDCLEVMKTMPENSVDAIVTDPPYGIRFMGKSWDGADIEKRTAERRKLESNCPGAGPNGGHKSIAAEAGKYDLSPKGMLAFQEFSEMWAREAFRVLKPGGHLLSFASPRTYHRMTCGIEAAGFEIRDMVAWMFGQGFPKSHDISKAIDKAAGAEREVVGENPNNRPSKRHGAAGFDSESEIGSDRKADLKITAPSTPEAKQWSGWGTALKPAHEPVVLARKPLEGTVAKNVLKHGTGGLNIDGCRVEAGPRPLREMDRRPLGNNVYSGAMDGSTSGSKSAGETTLGRFPSNVILDEEAAAMLDEQTGKLRARGNKTAKDHGCKYEATSYQFGGKESGFAGNVGGASKFFYVAKASKQDRNSEGAVTNGHPTVKPTKLMSYLIKLVTPPAGIVLDPFMGSGSTGVAAVKNGFDFIGIEMNKEYFEIAERRIEFEQTWQDDTDQDEEQMEFEVTA